jgi:hypothetical protein
LPGFTHSFASKCATCNRYAEAAAADASDATAAADAARRAAAAAAAAKLGAEQQAADGRGLSLAHNRTRVYASSQLFCSPYFTTTEATTLIAAIKPRASSIANTCEHGVM